jgi:hypothetical protein
MLLALFLPVLLLLTALLLAVNLLNSREIQESIVSQVTGRLQRKITFSHANITFRPTPAFTFHDLVIRERDDETTFLAADRLTFRLAIAPLLKGEIALGTVFLDEPRVTLIREKDGSFNFSDLLSRDESSKPVSIRGLRVRGGALLFRDSTISPPPPPLSLEDVELRVSNPGRGRTANIKLNGTLREEGKTTALSASGSISISAADHPLTDSVLDLSVAARRLDMGSLWPYYRHLVPFRQLRGEVDTTTTLSGKVSQMTIRGETHISRGHLDYPAAFEEAISPPDFRIAYDLEASSRQVNITSFSLDSPLLSLKGRCNITGLDTGDPRITASATSAPFRLKPAQQLIPYPIIATGVADFIRQHIKDGTFTLTAGNLDGRISQIAHMEKGENYNVLSIRATCENGLLEFGSTIPAFNGVSGTLQLQGKDFILSGMKGLFGTSPFTLEGKIRDYPLHKPSTYPFSMVTTPRQKEVAWLLGEQGTDNVSFDGSSTLSLAGEGTTSAYSLTGKWDLTGSRYALFNQIAKPAGRANSLTFSSILGEEGVRIPSLSFALSPLTLDADARIRFKGGIPLTFTVKSSPVALQEISPFLPGLKPFQPGGRLQATVTGEARSWAMSSLKLGGEASLSGVTFKAHETLKPLTHINGKILFRGDSLETSQLSAAIGSSVIQGSGSLKGFSSPEFSVTFKSRRLDPKDLGLQGEEGKQVLLRRVSGTISYHDGTATLKNVGAKINSTPLTVSGSIRLKPKPVYDLTATSPELHSDDLMLLASLQKSDSSQSGSPMNGKLQLKAETGTLHTLPFRKLQADLTQEGSIFYVQPLELQLLNGKASGRLRIDRTDDASPRYQASYAIERISSQQLFSIADNSSRLITGTLSLHGDLTARGSSQQELRKTALGNVQVRFEDGMIRKLPVLSKIFSILNVSQLFKLQLPDMARDGMPYNAITASVACKDGIMSTSDLKIDSNSINISAIGNANLIKEELDLTVGVKPLQTVDKVVSKIPLVGWVLTGKDKTLLTAWYEVKGSWSDPQITGIPISSLSRGVLGIFQRLLGLPGKIITDTGEIILGN